MHVYPAARVLIVSLVVLDSAVLMYILWHEDYIGSLLVL
jgi:hypothetical protein